MVAKPLDTQPRTQSRTSPRGSGPELDIDCENQSVESPGWVGKANAVLTSPWATGIMVIALGWALLQVAPWSEWKTALANANPLYLGLALLFALPSALFKVGRMETLIPVLKPHRVQHSNIVFAMECVGQMPVGTVGGDVFRICRLDELGVDAETATAATFLVRITGFAVTIAMASLAGAYVFGEVWPLAGLAVTALVLTVLVTSQKPPRWVVRLSEDRGGKGLVAKLRRGLAGILHTMVERAAKLSRTDIAKMVGFTLGVYAARTLVLWMCLLAVGVDVPVWAALAALAAGNLASSIPSPAGNVGLREGGIVGILSGFGASVAPATIGAILFRAAVALGAGLGFVLSWAWLKARGPSGAAS